MNDAEVTGQDTIQRQLAAYQRPSRARSIWQLINSIVPYLLLWGLAVWSFREENYWILVPTVLLMSGFIVRIFIIFHDCGHNSFFRSKKVNNFWGVVTGIMTFTPYHRWRASHARHHGTSANLDKRGEGDVWMMTIQEYLEAPRAERVKYRLYRNPFVMFILGPLLITLVNNRIPGKKSSPRDRRSMLYTNFALLLMITGMIVLIGWKAYLLIQLPSMFLAHVAGVWLFYVQHQFEGVYWERESDWDFVTASLEGGSFYRLPGLLRWFSGSIGYHHIHHLNSRVPNYYLTRCQDQIMGLKEVKGIGFWASLKSLTFRLWDEETGRLVGFRELSRSRAEG